MTTAQISASQVKQLRDATGAGMMECKKVLVEAGGDIDAALTLLKERGIAKAGKLGARETTEGRVGIAEEGLTVALVEVGCNTDFVAKNDDFAAFVDRLAKVALEHRTTSVEALAAAPWDDGTVEDARLSTSAGTGENVEIRRVEIIEAQAPGAVSVYQHGMNLAAVVTVTGSDADAVQTFATDVAMHAAGHLPRPQYLTRDEVPADVVAAERDIFLKQAEDKPEEIRGKIADGKLNKWYSDIVLPEQTWIFGKDRVGKDVTIDEYRSTVAKDVGADLAITSFVVAALKG